MKLLLLLAPMLAFSQTAFVPVSPCRLLDTRDASNYPGGQITGSGRTLSMHTVVLTASGCPNPLPSSAQSYSLNLTVVATEGSFGFITAYPTGESLPLAASLTWSTSIASNSVIVQAGTGGAITVACGGSGCPVDLVVDLSGYFIPIAPALFTSPVLDAFTTATQPYQLSHTPANGLPVLVVVNGILMYGTGAASAYTLTGNTLSLTPAAVAELTLPICGPCGSDYVLSGSTATFTSMGAVQAIVPVVQVLYWIQ